MQASAKKIEIVFQQTTLIIFRGRVWFASAIIHVLNVLFSLLFIRPNAWLLPDCSSQFIALQCQCWIMKELVASGTFVLDPLLPQYQLTSQLSSEIMKSSLNITIFHDDMKNNQMLSHSCNYPCWWNVLRFISDSLMARWL